MDLATNVTLAALAVALEASLGYPQGLFRAIGHPVTWIGRLIALADEKWNHDDRSFAARRALGFAALILLLSIAGGGAYLFSRWLAGLELPQPAGLALTALIASSLIAQRSLDAHVLAVAEALSAGLAAGREAVAKIAGRNVETLDEAGVARAAIESLAENFSDAVVAPAFWLALGGLAGGACYKAVNTADSMVGHRTQRHAAFGFAAAKLDDIANFCPARLSACLVIIAAWFAPNASARGRVAHHQARRARTPFPQCRLARGGIRRRARPAAWRPARLWRIKIDDAWIGSGKEASSQDILRALVLYRFACGVHWTALTLVALVISQV